MYLAGYLQDRRHGIRPLDRVVRPDSPYREETRAVPSPRLAEAVAVHGHLRPHETALVFNDRTVTYGELSELTQTFRHSLLELRLPAGSAVCVPAHKTPETIALLLAVLLLWVNG